MNKNNLTSKLYFKYALALLPLIFFAIYKNGLMLHNKGYVNWLGTLKPIIIILMGVSGTLLGIFIKTCKRKNKIDFQNIRNYQRDIIDSIILALALPLKSSPLIIFLLTLFTSLFIKKNKFNKIVIIYLLISLINKTLGLNIYENMYEQVNVLNYNGLDIFIGFGIGGIGATSGLLIAIALMILSFDKLYKKEVVYSAIVSFLVIATIPRMINGEYNLILPSIFGYNIIYSYVFVAPDLYSTSYTTNGQILSGIMLGVMTWLVSLILPYEASFISILVINMLGGIFDRIFIIK